MSDQEYTVSHLPNGNVLLTPNTADTGCGAIIFAVLLGVIFVVVSVYNFFKSCVGERLETINMGRAERGFLKGDFLLIQVEEVDDHEEDRERVEELEKACMGHFNPSKPLATEDSDGSDTYITDYLAVTGVQVNGMPSPTIIRRYRSSSDDEGLYDPIYALFKGPDALEKLKKWGRENGYSEQTFSLKIKESRTPTVKDNEWYIQTEVSEFKKPGSKVALSMYFAEGGQLYYWTGQNVYELSKETTPDFIKTRISIAR